MTPSQNMPRPGNHELGDVQQAALLLQAQACTLSARHIQDGMLRLQFNREVAYWAQGIVKDVEAGTKSPEERLNAIEQEQEGLLKQSVANVKKAVGLMAGIAQMTAALMFCGKAYTLACVTTGTVLVSHGVNNTIENTQNLIEDRTDAKVQYGGFIKKAL